MVVNRKMDPKKIKAKEKEKGKKIYPKRTKARQDFKDIKSLFI